MLVNLLKVAVDHRLSGSDWRVLIVLLQQLGPYNCLAVNKAGIASILKVKRPNVSRCVANLTHQGILVSTGEKQGRNWVYCLGKAYSIVPIGEIVDLDGADGEHSGIEHPRVYQEVP